MNKLMTSIAVLAAGTFALSGCGTSSTVSEPTAEARETVTSTSPPVGESIEENVPFTMTADERMNDLTNALGQAWETDTKANRAEACRLWVEDRSNTLTTLMGGSDAEPIGVTVGQAESALSAFFDSKCTPES